MKGDVEAWLHNNYCLGIFFFLLDRGEGVVVVAIPVDWVVWYIV